MSLYILTGAALIFLAIIWYNYHVSKKIIIKQTENSAYNLCQSILHQTENMLLPPRKIPENVAALLENTNMSRLQLENFLKIVVSHNKDIFGSCIAFEPYAFMPDSMYYAPYCYHVGDSTMFKDLGKGGYNYTKWPWYTLPKEKGPCWTEPYFDEGGGDTVMVTYSVPFYWTGQEKKIRGVATVDISLEKLRHMIDSIKILKSGYAFLLSGTGAYISHPDSSVIQTESIFGFAEKHDQPELAAIGREMVSGREGFTHYYSLMVHDKCYIYYTSFPTTGWSLGMVIPEREILADLYRLNRTILLIGLAGFIMLFFLIILISRTITNPIKKLADATQRIGAGDFGQDLPIIDSGREIAQLSHSFSQMQERLTRYIHDLKVATAAKEKIESELKIAHDIQQGIIPKTFPPFPLRNDVDIFAVLIPAREVGGDLYDYFFIENDILAFAIGDVSGKGVPSSLFMAITRTLLRAKAMQNTAVNAIIQSINEDLCVDNDNAMFVTLFLGLINLKTGEVTYCNAGHNYPYIIRHGGEVECLSDTHGTPVGLFRELEYSMSKVVLKEKDNFVLYTDGISEAMNESDELYGDARLKALLERDCRNKTVRQVTSLILEDVMRFSANAEQSDDITILTLSRSKLKTGSDIQ